LHYGRLAGKQNAKFIFIPILSFDDLSVFSADKPSENLLALKEKEKLVRVGNFLMNLYSGQKFKDQKFLNLTDVFVKLNTEKDSNATINDTPDKYLGVTQDYIDKLHDFVTPGKSVSTPDFSQFDDLLKGSFYEFVYKLSQLDLASKKQFKNYEEALSHPFLEISDHMVTQSDS